MAPLHPRAVARAPVGGGGGGGAARRAPAAGTCLVACAAAAAAAAWSCFAPAPGAFVTAGLQPVSTYAVSGAGHQSAATARRAFDIMDPAEPPPDDSAVKMRPLTPSAEHLEYSVVEFSGRQHMVVEGGMYETRFIRALPGSKVRLNRVMLMKHVGPGGDHKVILGQPVIDGAYAEITILEHLKSEDQEIYKHKSKKHYQKRYIVFQLLTRFRVDKIVWAKPGSEVEGHSPYPMVMEDGTQAPALPGDLNSRNWPRMYYTRPLTSVHKKNRKLAANRQKQDA